MKKKGKGGEKEGEREKRGEKRKGRREERGGRRKEEKRRKEKERGRRKREERKKGEERWGLSGVGCRNSVEGKRGVKRGEMVEFDDERKMDKGLMCGGKMIGQEYIVKVKDREVGEVT
ncbi:hypothetical protein, partial [Salmonella enterica]|uniref:hypothetical protein n=1 Tax=Salmonella enterica TaxID=28901 RepID=UPI00398C330D